VYHLPGCPVCVGQCQVTAPEENVNNQHNFCLLRTSPNHDLVLLPAVHAAAACVPFSAVPFVLDNAGFQQLKEMVSWQSKHTFKHAHTSRLRAPTSAHATAPAPFYRLSALCWTMRVSSS
jgi:hypothetical protein